MKSELRKLTLKLLLLVMMIGGLFFIASSRTAYASSYCDMQYAQCMQGCGQPIDQICAYNCGQDREWCEFWIG
jgi:hypothetical protein